MLNPPRHNFWDRRATERQNSRPKPAAKPPKPAVNGFGAARARLGAVTYSNRKLRRFVACLMWLRTRALSILRRVSNRVKPITDPRRLLAATCVVRQAFDRTAAGSVLAAKARLMQMCQELSNAGTDKSYNPACVTKEDIMLLKIAPSADCLQHEPSPVAPPTILTAEPVRFWAGRSDTPGLSDKISTKESANTLAAARKANSPFLTDGARVRSGALA
jgi:hypothetical protein